MGLRQKDAAAVLGLSAVTVSVYETGGGKITEERVRELITKLQVANLARPMYQAVQMRPHSPAPVAPPPGAYAAPPELLRYIPDTPRRTPKVKVRTCPLPRGAVDENEMCVCGSIRGRHDALKFSCRDCRRGSTGCQYFRPASRFNGAG